MQFLLEKDLKTARKLVNRGADLNYQNGLGQTALHICVLADNCNAIEWLLNQKKINRHLVDKEGNDPCDLAKLRPEIMSIFPEFLNCNAQVKQQSHTVVGQRHRLSMSSNRDHLKKSELTSPVNFDKNLTLKS